MTDQIFRKFKKFVEANSLFGPQSRLLVAISGGQDSVALVHFLLELKREWPELDVALAHFNHQLRKSADADERFVRKLARRHRLKIFVGRAKVREYARRHRLNLEEAGRLKRYEFLEGAAEKWGAETVLTAHTMNDQAETVLMKIFRGTGIEGLQGVRLRAGRVVRPLLGLKRSEIEQYLRQNNIEFRVDETNLDKAILRNKIRLELVPRLEREFDPEVVTHLGQLALIAQDENEALAELVEGIWPVVTRGCCGKHRRGEEGEVNNQSPVFEKEVEREKEGSSLSPNLELDMKTLKEMPVAVARRLVRKFLHLALGLESPSFEQTEMVLKLRHGQKFSWGKDRVLVNEGGWLKRVERGRKKEGFSFLWDGRQNIRLYDRWEFEGSVVSARELGQPEYDDINRCYLDADKLSFPLEVRSRKPGDKYRPLGMRGEKKLKDLLRERKIPGEVRDLLPVFVSEGKIVWVPGLPVADEFKITSSTQNIFLIKRGRL